MSPLWTGLAVPIWRRPCTFPFSLPFFPSLFPSPHIYIYTFISKMVTFINMVITRVKNGSPDMILTAFEGKFDAKKDEIPPGICRPHMHQNFQYWGFEGWHKTQKWWELGSQGVPMGPNLACTLLPYPQRIVHAQRGSILTKLNSSKHFWGVIKLPKYHI